MLFKPLLGMFTKLSKGSAMIGFYSFIKSICKLAELRKFLALFFKVKIIFPN